MFRFLVAVAAVSCGHAVLSGQRFVHAVQKDPSSRDDEHAATECLRRAMSQQLRLRTTCGCRN